MMNEGGQYNYNLSEIWQFPMTGRASETGAGIGASFGGPNPAQFGDWNLNASSNCDLSRLNQIRAAGSSGTRKRPGAAEDEAAQGVSTSNGNDTSDSGNKRQKATECGDEKGEAESCEKSGERKKQPVEPSKDYIHVRARRGQATDSHSLAERARREKISERMKILQDLVPGCNKVIGKALVLDEIINYIQSLQRQVEFLSMKLEAVNSRITPALEFGQQGFENASLAFGTEPAREYSRGTSPEWLHMQVGGGFERTS